MSMWVQRYLDAWRAGAAAPLEELFTEDVRYQFAPEEEPVVGLDALRERWPEDNPYWQVRDVEVWAEGPDRGVATLSVEYGENGTEPASRYRNVWLVRFAEDGRAATFAEHWREAKV